MARRKKRTARRARGFNINAIETGVALSLVQSTNAAGVAQQAIKGNVKGAFDSLSANIQSNKSKILATLAAGAIAKMATRGFKPVLAKLGPIRIKL